jgi:hypothetical protein
MSHQKLQLPFHTTGLNFYGGIFFISNCEVVTNKQGDMMYASAKLNLCKEKSSHQNARFTLFFCEKQFHTYGRHMSPILKLPGCHSSLPTSQPFWLTHHTTSTITLVLVPTTPYRQSHPSLCPPLQQRHQVIAAYMLDLI